VPDSLLAQGTDEDAAAEGAEEETGSLFQRPRPATRRALGSVPRPLPALPPVPPLPPQPPAIPEQGAGPDAPIAEREAPAAVTAAPPEAEGIALPRRVRQANLAPGLQKSTQAQPEWVPRTEGTPAPHRSPEQARATMASLRAGWARGRDAATTTQQEPPAQPPRQPDGPNDNPTPREETP
jgi:hypothetical protein